MRVQDLRDSPRDRADNIFHKRGWAKGWQWEALFRRRIQGNWFRFTITLGGEDTRSVSWSVGFLWWQIYLTFHNLLPKKYEIGWYKRGEIKNPRWHEDSHGVSYGMYMHENHFVLSWRASQSGWSSDGSTGWRFSCFLDEKILGRRDYSEVTMSKTKNVEIWFPERLYHLDIEIVVATWRYRRFPWWPLTRTVARGKVDVVEKSGILSPGKGESDWDQGDNNLHGLTTPATCVHDAIEAVRDSVNRQRRRHGGGEGMYRERRADVQVIK